ncbi:hypothetical protein KIPB_010063, partial [Kipferlia bialata]
NTNLYHINLDYAHVVGPLPECVCAMPHLSTLSVNGNYLNGPIPECLGGTDSALDSFRADCAFLSGTVPPGLLDGSVADVKVMCNEHLICPSDSDISVDTYFSCGLEGCDPACLIGPAVPVCEEVLEVPGCGPYYLDLPPCDSLTVDGTVLSGDTQMGLAAVETLAFLPGSLDAIASDTTTDTGLYSLDLTEYAGEAGVRVEYQKPGYIKRTEDVPLPLCGHVDVDTELQSKGCSAIVCVSALDECGEPVSGASVSLVTDSCDWDVQTGHTNDAGDLCFESVDITPLDKGQIIWSADGYSTGSTSLCLSCGINEVDIDLECVDPPSLVVEVSTAYPLASVPEGALVTWTSVDLVYSDSAVTDVSGTATFSPLPPEVVGMDVTITTSGIEGYPEYTDGMAYTLPCCGTLSLPQVVPCPDQRVCVTVSEFCAAEYPVYIAGIEVAFYDMADLEEPLGTIETCAGESSCFDIVPDVLDYPLSSVLVSFDYEGTLYEQVVELGCGDTEICLEVDCPPECKHIIKGTVTNEAGEPLPNVDVAVLAIPVAIGSTDANGNYAIYGVEEGSYYVVFSPQDSEYAEHVEKGVYIPECGVTVVDAVLECDSETAVCIRFETPCGVAAGLSVTLQSDGYKRTSYTGDEGEVCFYGDLAGEALVSWSSGVYECGASNISVGCGENWEVYEIGCLQDPSLIVQVRTDDPFAAAVEGATVTWKTTYPNMSGQATTDVFGTATFPTLPAAVAGKTFSIIVSDVPGYEPFTDEHAGEFPCCGPLTLVEVLPCTKQRVCVTVAKDCDTGCKYLDDVLVTFYAPDDLATPIGSVYSDDSLSVCIDVFPEHSEYLLDTIVAKYSYHYYHYCEYIPLSCGTTDVCLEVCYYECPDNPDCPDCPYCPDCPDCPYCPDCPDCPECPDCVHAATGVVSNEAGEPLGGIEVSIPSLGLSDTTNAEGKYTLTGGEGDTEYVVVFTPPPGSPYAGDSASVHFPECGVAYLDMVLPCTEDPLLKVTFVDPCGYPVEGLIVYLENGVSETTGADGTAVFPDAPLGYVTVSWTSDAYEGGSETFLVGCGETCETVCLVCEETLSLSVQVLTGAPFPDVAAGATVTWSTADPVLSGNAITDISGLATFYPVAADVAGLPFSLTVSGIPGYEPYSPPCEECVFTCCSDIPITVEVPCTQQKLCITVSEECDAV